MKPIECLFKGIDIDKSMDNVQCLDDLSVLNDTMVMSKFGFVEADIIQSINSNTNKIPATIIAEFFYLYTINGSCADNLLNIILSLGKDITLLKYDIFHTSFSDDLDLYPLFKLLTMHYDEDEFEKVYNHYHSPTRNDNDCMTVKDRYIISYTRKEDIYSFVSLTKPFIKSFLDHWCDIMAQNHSEHWYKSV